MTRPFRRGAAVGLSVLIVWALNPTALAADTISGTTPSPRSPPTASTSYPIADADFSLGVSPTRLVIGQDDIGAVQQVLVINKGRLPANVTVEKRNFTAGLTGTLDFQADAPFAASAWVTVAPETFVIASGATQTVTATIKTPASPDPGDHQVALVFTVPAGEGSGNIKINKGIGMPMYITVPGPVDTSSSVSTLTAPAFAIGGPVTITAAVRNTGTVHRDFRGDTALLVNVAGGATHFPDFTVPRASTRNVSTTWDPPLMCVCYPSVKIVNADGSSQSQTIRVIIFPLHIVGIALGAIVLIALFMRISRRRYRSSVIKAAAAMNRPVSSGDG